MLKAVGTVISIYTIIILLSENIGLSLFKLYIKWYTFNLKKYNSFFIC